MSRVLHFEIHAEDPERAAAFYHGVFGWEIKKWEGPMDYWMVMTGKEGEMGINGGIVKRQGPDPEKMNPVSAYVCTIDVNDLDAFWEKVTTSGGEEALPKMPIPGMGWLCYCKDTEGNIFGMMQNDVNAK